MARGARAVRPSGLAGGQAAAERSSSRRSTTSAHHHQGHRLAPSSTPRHPHRLLRQRPGIARSTVPRSGAVEVPIVGIEFHAGRADDRRTSFTTPTSATDYYDTKNPEPLEPGVYVKAHQEKYGMRIRNTTAQTTTSRSSSSGISCSRAGRGGDPLSGEALQQALIQNPVFKSVYGGDAENVGEMSFDTEAHTISKPMGVFAVKDGVPELLEPILAELVPPAERPA